MSKVGRNIPQIRVMADKGQKSAKGGKMLYVPDSNINLDRVVNAFGIISPAVTNQLFPLLG